MRGLHHMVRGGAIAALCLLAGHAVAQPEGTPMPEGIRWGSEITPEPGVEIRTYTFEATGEQLPYAVYASSKIEPGEEAPLIVALRGFTGTTLTIVRGTAVDLAEEGGYILVGAIGYNNRAGFGVAPRAPRPATAAAPAQGDRPMPPLVGGSAETDPAKVTAYSEQDVMNVLAMVRKEFNVDDDRIYLMGHSQGGGGARHLAEKYPDIWAGVALLAPALFDVELTAESNLVDIPVLLAVGDQDSLAEGTKDFSERLAALDAEVEYKLYEGLDHGTIILGSMPEVFRFFDAHSRPATRRDALADAPGTGRFPAMKEVDPGLPGQVIYRPANLAALGNVKLGVYAFGNGSCTDDAAHSRLHLLEVASHGYLVIVPGSIYSGPGAIERPAHLPPAGPNAVLTTHAQLGEAITWALAENARVGSPYHGLIDPEAIAVSGFSCGGLQALLNAGDPRVRTVVMMNSGLFPEGETTMAGMTADKSLLETVHTPILYVLGGETDIAYTAGMDDFTRIDGVPAAAANIERGHGGTYWDANGGAAAQVVVQWLDWQLRGDDAARKAFVGERCGLCTDPAWTLQTRGLE